MAFIKGVHRFIIDIDTSGSYTGVIPYRASGDGEWERLSSIQTYGDALLPENYASVIASALNTVFDGKCTTIENTESGVARSGVGLPNANGQGTSSLTLEFSNANSSKWVRGTAVPTSDNPLLRLGITSDGVFNKINYDFQSGRIVWSTSNSYNTTSSEVDRRGPLIIKVMIADDYYAVGLNNHYSVNTVDAAKGTFIDTNIIVGKTDTNKDYMIYGRVGSDSGYPTAGIIIKDSNEVIFQDMLSFEHPEVEQLTYAKLTPISAGGHNTGWYYAPKQYTSIYGNWNKAYNVVDEAVCIGSYLTKGIDENVFTINNKSFDALIGSFSYNYGIYREHVNNG